VELYDLRFDLSKQCASALDDQQTFLFFEGSALPAINGLDGRKDVDAGSKLSFYQMTRDLPAFILISCGDEDYNFIRHKPSRAARTAAKFRACWTRAAIARPAVFGRESVGAQVQTRTFA
jgi:hypothetical protein